MPPRKLSAAFLHIIVYRLKAEAPRFQQPFFRHRDNFLIAHGRLRFEPDVVLTQFQRAVRSGRYHLFMVELHEYLVTVRQ